MSPLFLFSYYCISLFYQGNHIFEVPTGHRMRIVQDGPGLLITCPIFLLSLVPFCEKATTLTYFSTKITCDVKRVVHNASVFLLEVYYSINYLCWKPLFCLIVSDWISLSPEFVAKLDPISKEMMDSGTWYWKYAVDGAHVKLEMVEL